MSEIGPDCLGPVANYYSERAVLYGATPFGVDWTCIATQQMRFVQLLRICDRGEPASIDDLGCGYAALGRFIAHQHPDWEVDYLGIDVSPEMVRLAEAELSELPHASAVLGSISPRQADYSIASGIFNVCLDEARDRWTTVIEATLMAMVRSSRRGVAVNFLAPTAGPPEPGLYRTPADPWIDFCREQLGAAVEVVRGYGMSEFTLLLR